jgi:adenosine deaminase
MSIVNYIQAMPKAELHLHLEGAIPKESLLRIAEQNEISESLKHFNNWVQLVENPDIARMYDNLRVFNGWLREAEDLTRVVYDVGVMLAKQNVRYAEISVNPAYYPDLNLSLDDFLNVINDGRTRAERAWGVRIQWVLTIPRDEPRRADDLARWATGVTASRGGVIALGLSGRESDQPVGQFERAFRIAEKKGLPCVARTGDGQGAEGVLKTLEVLMPQRITDGWGLLDSKPALSLVADSAVTLGVNLTRAAKHNWVESTADYPLRELTDNAQVFIGADMPAIYQSTLSDEYLRVVEDCGFSVDELDELALNAVRASFLPEDEKAALEAEFKQAFEALRAEHLPEGAAAK